MINETNALLAHIRDVLDYDPTTGVFVWKKHLRRPDLIGTEAGNVRKTGYRVIAFFNTKRLAHRVAWAYVTGRWPTGFIDHINGDPSDNRFCNLREVNCVGNQQNRRGANKNSVSGFLGVSPHQGKWRVQIMANGVMTRISGFNTPEEAHEVYLKLKREKHSTCSI